MPRKFFTSSLALLTYTVSAPIRAEDLNISPEIFSGITYIEYSQEAGVFSGTTFSDFDVAGLAPFIGGSLQLNYGPAFFSVRGQRTFEGDDSDRLTVTSPLFNRTATLDSTLDSTFRRWDVTGLIGYDIESKPLLGRSVLTLFAGYKYANANIKNDVSGIINAPPFLASIPVTGDLNVDFTYHGPQVGVIYSFPIDLLKGKLSFSSAFTYYLGEIDQQFEPNDGREIIGSREGTSDADSIGYLFNIGWEARLFGPLHYALDFDVSKSDFDTDGNASNFSETEYRFRAGITYNIDAASLFGRQP